MIPRRLARGLRRLGRLYRLLWIENRVEDLEARAIRTQATLSKQRETLKRQGELLESQRVDLQKQLGSTLDRIDLVKSSTEVSPAFVREFFEWKALNPVPERPLVTVAVATYNRSRLLTERCIPSILNQTYGNLELIVVGDGCTDDTEERVSGIDDPRLKFFNLRERGDYPSDPERRWMVAGTLPTNEALSMANGSFISHIDDDDEYLPDRLEKLVTLAHDNNCDFVWHPFWKERHDGEWELFDPHELAHSHVTNGSAMYRSWFTRIPPSEESYLMMEPGDWSRFRKIKYIRPPWTRHPDPLLKKYRGTESA